MKEKKSIFTLLVAASASICLTACDLTSLLGGGSRNNKSSFESQTKSNASENSSVVVNGSFSFTADESAYPTYFRCTSFGDFDYAKKTFKEPDYYDAASMISDGSVHPLCYLGYKIEKLYDLGVLPEGFSMTNYEISYDKEFTYYPTPECQTQNDNNALTNSDAYYISAPIDGKYSCQACYLPAYSYVIDILKALPVTGAVNRDEKAYYKYALDHYTLIPQEYENIIDEMIYENGWYQEELSQVDSIASYVSKLGRCSLFNEDGSVDVTINGSRYQSDDPVTGLINNGVGSDFDFNTVAVMIFRRLNIPARMVQGYLTVGNEQGINYVTPLNQHYWAEIYVKGTGWMILDAMDLEAIVGINPYGSLDMTNGPLRGDHILERIVVTAPNKTEYYQGEELDISGGYITAYFKDGTDSRMTLDASGVSVTGFDSSAVGVKTITVSYTYEGVTKSGNFIVTVVERS